MKSVPPWRQHAAPGLSLAIAARAAAPAETAPVLAAESKARTPLYQIVQPAARERWLGPVASSFDPQRVESTLRSALSGNLVGQWQLFDLMEDTSPRILKNLNEVKRAVLGYQRDIEAWEEEEESTTPEAERRAKVISNALWKMSPHADEDQNGFDQTIYDIMDAWGKGIAVLEIDWQVREAGKLGLITAPQCTRWIHPRFYGYPAQANWLGLNVSEIASARTGLSPTTAPSLNLNPALNLNPVDGTFARIPDNKFLVCVCKSRTGHPSVTALLRPLAFWWAASNFTQEWFLNLAQIFGLPIRWANYDPNIPGLVDQVADMLENMGSAAWGAFPTGTTLELKEPMKAGTDNPQVSLLDRAERNYDILILGQTLTTDVGQSGSRSLGEVHKTVRDDIVQAAADFVARIFNEQLIPMIERLNFGDNTLTPELCIEPEMVEDVTGLVTNYKTGTEAGVLTPNKDDEVHIRKKLALPAMSKEVEADWAGSAGVRGRAALPRSQAEQQLSPTAEAIAQARARAQSAATDKLVDHTLEQLTSVESKWLGGVKPFFHRLIALAQSGEVSDAEFVSALAKAQKEMPGLFDKLQPEHLAEALENAMSSAVVNGAVQGSIKRKLQTA